MCEAVTLRARRALRDNDNAEDLTIASANAATAPLNFFIPSPLSTWQVE